MTDETRQLARFAKELTYEQIPERVRRRGIELMIDQIGIQLGCSEMPWAKQIWQMYRSEGGVQEATVVRYGDRLPLSAAAFINSTFGHSFEYDDANPLTHGHAGAEIFPALLAVAEREHVSGRELLTTFIAAYEVRGRLGWALSPDLAKRGGPQYSTACGPFGAAAGVSRLLKQDAEGIRNAMAIAGCFSGGLAQYDEGGGSAKRIFAAISASNGLRAAQMGQSGISGPEGILEGGHGLLHIFADEQRPNILVAELGKKWTIESAVFKPYSCCAVIHSAIDGMRKLVSTHKLTADDIASVEVGYANASVRHVAITEPKDLLGMQFSTGYTLALTVLKGRNTPREYNEEALKDPNIAAFAAKVKVVLASDLDKHYESHRPSQLKLRTKSGAVLEELVMDPKGSKAVPFSKEDVDEKFRSQATDVLGQKRCEQLLQTLRTIDTLDDVAKLPSLFVV